MRGLTRGISRFGGSVLEGSSQPRDIGTAVGREVHDYER